MNPCEIISASAAGQICFLERCAGEDCYTITESGHSVVPYTTNRPVRNRYGRSLTIFPSQVDIIERISNPFQIARIRVRFYGERERFGDTISSQTFPTVKIVNLPTGVGKTIMATLGCLEALRLHKPVFESAFQEFLKSYEFRTVRGTICTSLRVSSTILLANVVFVFSPKHLVGQWRDTFHQNIPDGVHVFPRSDSFNLFVDDFNVADIQSRPNETFVFVTHSGNFKKLIVSDDEQEIVAGIAIFDEADSEHFPCKDYHTQIPVAMYTLFVTATPGNILQCTRTSSSNATTNLVAHHFTTPVNPGGIHQYMADYSRGGRNVLADVHAMQLVLPTERFSSNIVQEVSATIPDLHSYRVRTRRALARTFGTTSNDLENPRAVLERVEQDLEIRIYGQTIADMQEQLHEHIQTLRSIEERTKTHETRLERLVSTLRRVQEIDGFCGICLDDFTDTTSLRLTSCCGFFICPSCHERVRNCAKCRNPNVKYFDIVSAPKPSKAKKAASEPVHAPPVHQLSATKDVEGFELWVRDYPFFNVDQVTALNEITSAAMRFGLTHLIFAGSGVDTWSGLGPDADAFFAYSIVRPAGHSVENQKKTAKRLDAAYRRFCSGETPSVLILDSRRNDSVELTGIDAGVTDLIVQVGTDAGGHAYTQLAGRAMRFGRNPTHPIRIVMS
jgi:hypothetical protein